MSRKNESICALPVILAAVLLHTPQTPAAESPVSIATAVPFQPQLVEDNDPICPTLLATARQQFQSADEWRIADLSPSGLARIQAPYAGHTNQIDPNFKADAGGSGRYILSLGNGSDVFVYYVRIPGCGGACEEQAIAISDKAVPRENLRLPGDKDPGAVETPAAPEWATFRDSKGGYYVVGTTQGFVEAYRLARPKRPWRASCRVSLEPSEDSLSADARTRTAAQALNAMNDAADAVAGRDGDGCGTMQTAARWAFERKHALLQALYRPWGSHGIGDNSSKNSYGDFERIKAQLVEWSLGGIGEHRAFRRFMDQHDVTASVLSRYYQAVFGWEAKRADSSASDALDTALGRGFGFYDYNPYAARGEAQLRQALLEHRPMSDIRQISFDAKALDANYSAARGDGSDSVLNVAIEYPEALQYLLGKGLNPNQANDFGKTPLMYAVQDNQLDSVRALLDANANVNAATVEAPDRCTYALKNTHVTALHYAVRNASADIIRLLLARGAAPYMRASLDGAEAEYPLEWLYRYASGSKNSEFNRNLATADLPQLQQSLRPPSPQERNKLARDLVLKAEANYSSGRTPLALGSLQAALAADPSNEKALADLPVVALRAGDYQLSLAASKRILDTLKSPSALAAAWFNTGLACDRAQRPLVQYDGATYCQGDSIEPYIRAWQEQPTGARAEKIRESLRRMRTFNSQSESESCAFGRTDTPDALLQSYIVLNSGVQRLYLWQRTGTQGGAAAVELLASGTKSPPVIPNVISHIDLGGDVVTVMQAPWKGSGPTGMVATVSGQQCHLY